MICSEHFVDVKSFDDLSFLPRLFPAGRVDGAKAGATKKQITMRDVSSCDFSVLENVVDKLPLTSAAGAGRSDTSQLQKAFCELASHVCRLLVAHDSELLIEGTVGVTVDGGARVMLLHFADQVRRTDASSTAEQNIHSSTSESTAVGIHDEARDGGSKDGTVNKLQTNIHSAEETVFTDGDSEWLSLATQSSHCPSASAKILSDLALQTASTICTNSESHSDAAASPTHKRKSDLDGSSITDKSKPQTLLRELLCAPMPPKRPCRPVNPGAAAAAIGVVSEVARPRRLTANSTVLGGLLRTGTYQRDSNYSLVGNSFGRDALPKYAPSSTVAQSGYGSQSAGIDVQRPQFGGNAVQALLKLASEHAASRQHDLQRNNKHREGATSQAEGFMNDGLADASLDQHFSTQQPNLSGADLHRTNSKFISTSTNIARNDSSSMAALTVKQEIVDPSYD